MRHQGRHAASRLVRSTETQNTRFLTDRLAILSAEPVGAARLTTVLVEVTPGRVVQSSSASDGLDVGLASEEAEAEGWRVTVMVEVTVCFGLVRVPSDGEGAAVGLGTAAGNEVGVSSSSLPPSFTALSHRNWNIILASVSHLGSSLVQADSQPAGQGIALYVPS